MINFKEELPPLLGIGEMVILGNLITLGSPRILDERLIQEIIRNHNDLFSGVHEI
jgi:hypothetical protein